MDPFSFIPDATVLLSSAQRFIRSALVNLALNGDASPRLLPPSTSGKYCVSSDSDSTLPASLPAPGLSSSPSAAAPPDEPPAHHAMPALRIARPQPSSSSPLLFALLVTLAVAALSGTLASTPSSNALASRPSPRSCGSSVAKEQ